ncbi:MAG: cell division protein ZipA C-terminal FtsZ-binding domain-containing protein [Burkholderiaceae bacterium]
MLNPVTDCIVEVRLAHPYPADRLIGLSQSLRRVGAKPVLFEGWYASQGLAAWVPIAPGQPSTSYGLIRVGVLLANRHGPLNAMEFAEFTNGLGTLVTQLSASARLPEMKPVLEKARALDDACIELDAQVGLNVDAGQPLSPSDLERLAREQRLVERGSNRYARLGPAGEVLFSVSQIEQPNRITFLLDVPRAPAALQPWPALVECAKVTAVRLQGSLVDDEGRPLPDQALEQIGEQIAARADALEQAGFPAGSPLALRLFN